MVGVSSIFFNSFLNLNKQIKIKSIPPERNLIALLLIVSKFMLINLMIGNPNPIKII